MQEASAGEVDFNVLYLGKDTESKPLTNIAPRKNSGSFGVNYVKYLNLKKRAPHKQPTQRFFKLKNRWLSKTAHLSVIRDKSMHPTYQQIIGMGKIVLPLILNDMQKEENHWFWALTSITGEDPVPPQNRGQVKEMTKAWTRWGIENGFLVDE